MLFFGLIVIFVNITSFAYFLISSYQAKLESEFLSLDEEAGTCNAVTISTSTKLLVDKDGNWDSSTLFKPEAALFVIEFTAYRADDDTWKKDMDKLNDAIVTEMDYLRSISDISVKMLHLISWRKTITATQSGTILVWFDADPTFIFDTPGDQLDSVFGNIGDNCAKNDGWSMNDGTLSLEFSNVWDGTSFLSDGRADLSKASPTSAGWDCDNFDIADGQYGYDLAYPSETFNFKVDLRTSATVASLTASIMPASDLSPVADKLYLFPDDDAMSFAIPYSVSFDPKYPNMQAIYTDSSTDPNQPTYLQRFGYSAWKVEFTHTYTSWIKNPMDQSTNRWETPAYAGPYACPDKCGTEGGAKCNSPDYVFEYTNMETPTQTFKVRLKVTELFTINLNNLDPGKIGCATTTDGSKGVLGQLEPVSAAAFEANLDKQPFKLVSASLPVTTTTIDTQLHHQHPNNTTTERSLCLIF